MLRLIGRRLVESVPLMIVVCAITFLLVQLIPGSPAATILGNQATPEAIARLEQEMGLDRPPLEQLFVWFGQVLTGDLGNSLLTGSDVNEVVASRMPITMSLAIIACLLSAVLGIWVGVVAATRGGLLDRILTTGSGVGLALPTFWLAVVLVLVFSIWLRWLPATGYTPFLTDPVDWLVHLVLPLTALCLIQVAAVARQTRVAMRDELDRPYIRSLRAVGVPRRSVVWKHALRNAAIPVCTTLGLQFIGVLGGAVVIEQVFALGGVGALTVEAASAHDIPTIQGVVIYSTAAVIAVNLVVDILTYALSPKARVS